MAQAVSLSLRTKDMYSICFDDNGENPPTCFGKHDLYLSWILHRQRTLKGSADYPDVPEILRRDRASLFPLVSSNSRGCEDGSHGICFFQRGKLGEC